MRKRFQSCSGQDNSDYIGDDTLLTHLEASIDLMSRDVGGNEVEEDDEDIEEDEDGLDDQDIGVETDHTDFFNLINDGE